MKTVLLPIQVPEGALCWDGYILCDHFDNEHGHATCDLGFHGLEDVKKGVAKPTKCFELAE